MFNFFKKPKIGNYYLYYTCYGNMPVKLESITRDRNGTTYNYLKPNGFEELTRTPLTEKSTSNDFLHAKNEHRINKLEHVYDSLRTSNAALTNALGEVTEKLNKKKVKK